MGETTPAAEAGVDRRGSKADADGPRQCALSREHRPRTDLIRFALSPTGAMVPDIIATLPGRGVWLTATSATVAEAVRKQVFARSLKRQVVVPADLAEQVDRLLTERLRQALSFANKAGLVASGHAKVEAAVTAGEGVCLVQAADGSPAETARLARLFAAVAAAHGRPAPVVRLLGSAEMSLAIGRANVVHAVLAEGGQCRSFLGAALRLLRYRQSELAAELAGSGQVPDAPMGSGTETA